MVRIMVLSWWRDVSDLGNLLEKLLLLRKRDLRLIKLERLGIEVFRELFLKLRILSWFNWFKFFLFSELVRFRFLRISFEIFVLLMYFLIFF